MPRLHITRNVESLSHRAQYTATAERFGEKKHIGLGLRSFRRGLFAVAGHVDNANSRMLAL